VITDLWEFVCWDAAEQPHPPPLEASFVGHQRDAILQVDSLQAAGGHINGHHCALAQKTEFPWTLPFNEFQFAEHMGVADVFPIITEEQVPHL
jgi:hypothetical protein